MTAPQVAEWGPRLWRIFHSLVEKSGKGKHRLYDEEEKRAWTNLINGLRTALPCPLCRQHYKAYLKSTPFEATLLKKGTERQGVLREWFWTFHNHVRMSKEQPLEFLFEQVETTYKDYTKKDYDADVAVMIDHMRRGMFQRWLTRDDLIRVTRAFEELWRILHY